MGACEIMTPVIIMTLVVSTASGCGHDDYIIMLSGNRDCTVVYCPLTCMLRPCGRVYINLLGVTNLLRPCTCATGCHKYLYRHCVDNLRAHIAFEAISLKTSELFWDTEISTAILKVSDLRTV